MGHNITPAISPVMDIRDVEPILVEEEPRVAMVPVDVLKELEKKLRAEADACENLARDRNNNQWFRGCANAYRIAADDLFFAVSDAMQPKDQTDD